MSKAANNIIFFVLGAGVGAAVTWRLLKGVYRKKADDEVESVRRAYFESKPQDEVIKMDEEPAISEDDQELDAEFWKIYNAEQQQATITEILRTAEYVDDIRESPPYTIAPAEYGSISGYALYEYTYFADGILTNEEMEILDEDEIAKYIGRDALNHFGEYENDSVYIRNDALGADYAIFKDLRKYSYAKDEIPGFRE